MRERMKKIPLWMRIYLMVFGLVTVVIVFVSYRIIEVSIEYNLQREISSSLENHIMIGNSLKMYESTIDDYYPTLLKDILAKSFQNYGQYFTDQRSHLAITGESGEKHFSSISDEEEKVMSLVPPKDGRRSYVIRNIDARTVLFVSSWMKMNDELLRLDYAHDITSLIDDQKSLSLQISFWVLVGLTVFAVGLYVLIRQALRPLGLLSTQAQEIAKGSYQHRISVQRADEIGQLAIDFNYMVEAIQSNMELLQRGVMEREAFIASLAHEFKTPLTSIMGYASLLQNYHLDEKDVEQALRFIHSESKRLDGMSKKLLELFRLGNGEPPNKQQVDVFSLMQQLKIISQFTLDRRGQTLEIAYSVSTVTVDPELFLVLLSNLVENASKASENDTVIRLAVYTEDSFVVFCMEDHGCGVPEEHLANVFQPFFMLDSSRDRKKNGHGLGLSLCKAIATAHHGSIDMKSRLNGGTSVYTRVPVQTST
ncbi:HAMP domain-containing sensor histidine kinase [Brevibacillus sp. AG]|uniref:sensor histidine kinase n=1 Tax=Brevibacillus sp. AG TaxID=3020891 RepID=UPI0023306445|nr:HAMP domain-containing sensor histidine kinase [Brevibacillus sp. AG]MDC0762034.1 HAMP domain-containing sensor histidine kinase [Brevibacillus sp. AG]